MARLRYNGLATGAAGSTAALTLGASLTSGATGVTFNAALTYNNGTAVPTIAGNSDFIPLEILDANGHISEIVYLTAYTTGGTTGTITRGQEGTTGVAHSSGDRIVHGPTADDSPWAKALDLPLSSLTGWTAGTGTWAISGGVIRQSVANAASNRLRYTAAPIPQGELIAEADIKIDTMNQGTNSRAGFLLGYPPGADTVNSLLACLRGNGGNTAIASVYFENEGAVAGPGLTLGSTIAPSVWTNFRVHKVGGDMSVWLNGALVGTGHVDQSSNVDASTLAFYSYGTDASFRNLRVWTPTLP